MHRAEGYQQWLPPIPPQKVSYLSLAETNFPVMWLFFSYPSLTEILWSPRSGMSNMRPFASTPAARTKDTVIWSFNGQNCSFYNLNWINVHRPQKNSVLFFIQNKNKNILQ